jgi:hypothetical protein
MLATKDTVQTDEKQKHDSWFDELMDLAAEGNAEAIHDLWLTYGYDFATEGRGDE